MTNDEIKKIIQSKYPDKYPDNKIGVLDASLDKMTPAVRMSLENFLQSGQRQDISVLGYSLDKLMNEHGMNEVATYLTIDWIIREPTQAFQSLRRGHDFIK